MLRDPFAFASTPAAIGRVVTATITIACVLIVYDGWASLRFLDVVLIIVGPVVAVTTRPIAAGVEANANGSRSIRGA